MRSVGRYLVRLGRPLSLAGDVQTVVQWVVAAIALIASPTILGVAVGPAWALAGVLGVLLVLSVLAGLALQRESDHRGVASVVEAELVAAWEELNVATSRPGVFAWQRGIAEMEDWTRRTAEYIRLALGPAAAGRFTNPNAWFSSPRDARESVANMLLALAGSVDEREIRAGVGELARAAAIRRDNALRRLVEAERPQDRWWG
ncbi:hypothetical protein [Conexibacter arvalis]|uniref:Uncharacterized protein n=1 Tax=Conexibacter arvalis TaxID=912552 RepID=A0A840IDW5_9ACTN|nr:hypothetical protein [Conexibacter arvalis]MBB4663167.1 hypothetical protein [Conexibacter arvalis]